MRIYFVKMFPWWMTILFADVGAECMHGGFWLGSNIRDFALCLDALAR
jgi:hypothetical protein